MRTPRTKDRTMYLPLIGAVVRAHHMEDLEAEYRELLKICERLKTAGEYLRQDLDGELDMRGKNSELRCAVIEYREAVDDLSTFKKIYGNG